MRKRVVLLLSSPTSLPLSYLSTACIRRRPSSPPDRRDACSSTPCAPARHRRRAPRLSAGRVQSHACFSTPRAHARHRRPARARRQGRGRAFSEERPRRRAPSRRHVNSPDRCLPPPPLVTGGARATAQQPGTAATLRLPSLRNGRLSACRRVGAPPPAPNNSKKKPLKLLVVAVVTAPAMLSSASTSDAAATSEVAASELVTTVAATCRTDAPSAHHRTLLPQAAAAVPPPLP